MEIHNLMEDIVRGTVDELFDSEERSPKLGFCTCSQCRLDVSCYVLNRIPPEYVTSGRGVVHGETDWSGKVQRTADVLTLVREGWTRINLKKRPQYHQGSPVASSELPEGPVFNFPSVMGRLFNGVDFSPLEDIQVGLYREDELLPMIDPNWQNPCRIVRETEGMYIFWPRPLPAGSAGEEAVFQLRVHAEIPGFEAVSHYFELSLDAEPSAVDQITVRKVYKLPDLYVFPK
mgnify:FL=1